MSRPFRWQYIVPRLVLVVVALLAAQYALGLAARNAAIRKGEAIVGAPVDLADARVSLTDRQIVLSDLRIANPCRPTENLLEADRCELDFAVGPLLHKQALIESARITGLRFGTPHAEAAPKEHGKPLISSPASTWFNDNAAQIARDWLTSLGDRFKLDLVPQFESVARSEALCARWQQRAAEIDGRAEEMKRRAAVLQEHCNASDANRLRHAPFSENLPIEIAALRKDYASLSDEVENLPQVLEDERRAIVASGRQDEQLLRERLRLEPIDSTMLTAYLLREQAAGPLNEVIGWMRWMRQAVPANGGEPHDRKRGEDILFAGVRQAPNFLIRALELQGSAHIGAQPVELCGALNGITSTPRLCGEPLRLRLTAAGPLPLELQATIDRTGAGARDEILLDCRGLILPELCLGQTDQLQMRLASSIGSLSVSVSIEGDKLAGDIQLVQKQVRITPVLCGELSDVPLATPLEATLGQVDSIATRLSLQGTIDEPSCTLWSNLGPAVAEAMERALHRTGDDHARAMLAEARRQVDERLAGLERQIADQQTKFASQMTGLPARLDRMAIQQTRRERISAEQLGRRLPENSLFR